LGWQAAGIGLPWPKSGLPLKRRGSSRRGRRLKLPGAEGGSPARLFEKELFGNPDFAYC
jgi:hypothetical protein